MKHIRFFHKGAQALSAALFFLCINSISFAQVSNVAAKDEDVRSLIKRTVIELKSGPGKINGEVLSSVTLIKSFYKGRDFLPAWSEDGRLIQVGSLLMAIEDAYGDGLIPEYYHTEMIKSLSLKLEKGSPSNSSQLCDFDVLMTDAFLTLGCHLSAGCVNPVTLATMWFAKSNRVDVSSVLEKALKKKQIREALSELKPQKDMYSRLKSVLAHYRALSSKAQWPLVEEGPPIKKGEKSDRVLQLRKRLEASGDLISGETEKDVFDDNMQQSVMAFQRRHGLKDDGTVGRGTLAALNVPLSKRIRQMEINMERLRWILGSQEDRFLVVNIADFRLDIMENDKSVLSMRVVVGKPYMRTPIFSAKMTNLVFNPQWNIPSNIVKNEILSKVQKDPNYLDGQHIQLVQGQGSGESIADPKDIDWDQAASEDLPYRFRQTSGKWNVLGKFKFVFPNEYDVYLHDTPYKSLFSEEVRTFSHGCARVEKPLDLAEYLLRDDAQWTRKAIEAAVAKGTEQTIRIPRPLNVHFLYLTAWVDKDNVLQFRNDIYGRDPILDRALQRRPSFN
jgi:L,D-transpeptidase YcbB